MNQYFACFGLQGSFVLTMLLSLSALILAILQPCRERWLIFAAMVMSSIGDLFLMNFANVERYVSDAFALGAIAFMVSHLIYACAYGSMSKRQGGRWLNGGTIAVAAIAIGCVAYFTRMCMIRHSFARFPLALVYLGVICVNVAISFAYAWDQAKKNPTAILAALGALLFFASDVIIGLGMLAGIRRWNYLIWWLYPIGQMLLIGAPCLCFRKGKRL